MAGCYEHDRDQWRGVKNKAETIGEMLIAGQAPLAGC
jgi:hypothetical protein